MIYFFMIHSHFHAQYPPNGQYDMCPILMFFNHLLQIFEFAIRASRLKQDVALSVQPPETLTAENGCFPRSLLATGPPFKCADKDL